jgi:hypothetical protein
MDPDSLGLMSEENEAGIYRRTQAISGRWGEPMKHAKPGEIPGGASCSTQLQL